MSRARAKPRESMSSDASLEFVWDPATQVSSLEYWDYSIELDCLREPQGIL